MHLEFMGNIHAEIIRRAATAKYRFCRGGIVDAVAEQVPSNVDADYFTEHHPGVDLIAIGAGELEYLGYTTL
jgi:hypothetical protein